MVPAYEIYFLSLDASHIFSMSRTSLWHVNLMFDSCTNSISPPALFLVVYWLQFVSAFRGNVKSLHLARTQRSSHWHQDVNHIACRFGVQLCLPSIKKHGAWKNWGIYDTMTHVVKTRLRIMCTWQYVTQLNTGPLMRVCMCLNNQSYRCLSHFNVLICTCVSYMSSCLNRLSYDFIIGFCQGFKQL